MEIGNNSFIDARSNVKKSFILAIIAAVFVLIYMNYYGDGYTMSIVVKNLIKGDGQEYSNPFVDWLWWINLLNLVSTVALVAVIAFLRFTWKKKIFLVIPAAVKVICACADVFVLYTRNLPVIAASATEDNLVYSYKGGFLVFSVLYILAYLLLLVAVFLPGKPAKTVSVIAIGLIVIVNVAAFFAPTPYSFPYTYVPKEVKYAYRSFSAQINDILFALSIVSMTSGLRVYHECMEEDAAAQD